MDNCTLNDYLSFKEPALGEPHEHFTKQEDKAGFWNTMRIWTQEAFFQSKLPANNLEEASAATLVTNIVTTKSGEASKIKNEVLAELPNKFNIVMKLNPKVIVCGTNDIYNAVMKEIKKQGASVTEKEVLVPTKGQKAENYVTYKNIVRLGNSEFVLGKFPQHPSRKNFIEQKDAVNYLASLLDLSTELQN